MKTIRPLKMTLLSRVDPVSRTLVVSAIVGFRFGAGELLREQEIWALATSQLGEGAVLDHGAAKVRGEVLVSTARGDSMRVRVGSVNLRERADTLAPRPADHRQRRTFLGTYDAEWLEQRAPARPDDFDPRFHNIATPELQIDGFFSGDEPVVVDFGDERIEGALPGLAIRAWITMIGEDTLHAVTTRIDTVHLFPEAKRGIVIFRGTHPVQDDEAEDVASLLIGLEPMRSPKSREHYEAVLARQLDPDKGHLYAIDETPLLPEGEPPSFSLAGNTHAGGSLMASHIERRAQRELDTARQRLRDAGLDPDAHLPHELPRAESEPMPTASELPAYIERMEREAEQHRKEAEAQHEQALARARAQCEEQGIDFDEAMKKAEQGGGGPPTPVAEQLAALQAQARLGRNAGMAFEQLERELSDPALQQKLQETYRAQVEGYRRFAHRMPWADVRSAEEDAALRMRLEAAHRAGQSLANWDLTGCDLSGIDLAGADLSDSFLERAKLCGANLAGCDLTRAVLTRADLTDADLSGAQLQDANLGEATLARTNVGSARLHEAMLYGAQMSGTSFKGADLTSADLSEAQVDGADFEGADLSDVRFLQTNLGGQRLRGAKLRRALFLKADLSGADLRGAMVERTGMVKSNFKGADLRDMSGERLCAALECSFKGADLRDAKLTQSSFLDLDMRGANLSGGTFDGSNFRKSDLSGANLSRSSMRQVLMMRATLDGADVQDSNLMQANLGKASLRGTRFDGANLFRANMSRTRVDDATSFEDAEMGHVLSVQQEHVATDPGSRS